MNENEKTIIFIITENQAKKICDYSYQKYEDLQDFEICNLLDKIIDNL